MIGAARTAVAFMTRIPVGDPGPLTPDTFSRAAPLFPAVGLLVGGVLAGTRALADLALAPGPATILALLAAVLVTGGFHEDGLADCADAAGAHVPRERRLEILHDSRVGTYGALAMVFAIAFPAAVLTPLDGAHVLVAALAGHVLGRWSTLALARTVAPSPAASAAALLHVGATTLATTSVAVAAFVLLVAGPGAGAVALGLAVALTALGGAGAQRVLGGVSGDVYGAVNKLVELGAYAALAAMWA